MYDRNNIFAQIIRNEAQCNKVYENDYALAFHDCFPKAKTHVLVIPKGPYQTLTDFLAEASDCEKLGFLDALNETIRILNVGRSGYKIISNNGEGGGQEVPHLHFHIIAQQN